MTEKLTPEEIKKALECCVNGKCFKCPLKAINCSAKVPMAFALDLINRQQTQIDTMLEDLQFRTNQVIEQQAEFERLNNLKRFEKFICERIHTNKERNLTWDFATKEAEQEAFEQELEKLFDISTVRVEAIKEFAERLKEEITTRIEELKATKSKYVKENYKCLSCDYIAKIRGEIEFLESLKEFIDNLAKEMVGEQE